MAIHRIKYAFCMAIILILLFFLYRKKIILSEPEKTNIVSWFMADVNQDSTLELLTILYPDAEGSHYLDTGEEYGTEFAIYPSSGYEIIDDVPKLITEPIYCFDMSEIKPTKIQAGDIDGDGITEIAICVYKTTKYHPVLAKRPFFYRLEKGKLQSVWLGSRLSRPFSDYLIVDLDQDGLTEIVSIESAMNGSTVMAAYDWSGFGFEQKACSKELTGNVHFPTNSAHLSNQVEIIIDEKRYQVKLEDTNATLNIEEELT